MTWLDGQETGSVIYVSFGSNTSITKEQVTEIWHGIANSKTRFLWVIRPGSITNKNDGTNNDGGVDKISRELQEGGPKENGYVVKWAPQEEVLRHKAIGGFLTHNGWNSTLESIVAGVPMICWPNFVDQLVNSRFVSEIWKIGLDMKDVCDRKIVEKMVNDLMVNKRDEFVKSSGRMAELARKSVSEGYDKIKSANSILIVGGGPTGVELAGEIAVDFPEKKVTLVHNGSRLMEFVGPKAAAKTLKWLKSKHVEVILEQRVDLDSAESDGSGSKTYHTSAGATIQADCHFLCTGKPLASEWLKNTVLKTNLDAKGSLEVDENLRVRGRKNVFAIGDITNIPEMKQGYLAQAHAEVAAKNLKILMAGGRECKLATYKPGFAIALVSLGRRDGVAQFPLVTISGIIPGMIKSKDLFVGKTRKARGLNS